MKIFQQEGFSLIELLVVIVIIGILAAVGTVTYDNYIRSSKQQLSKAQYDQIVKHVKNDLLLSFDSNSLSNKYLTGGSGNDQTRLLGYVAALQSYFNEKAGFKNPYNTNQAMLVSPSTSHTQSLKQGLVEIVYTASPSSVAGVGTLTIYLEASNASSVVSASW